MSSNPATICPIPACAKLGVSDFLWLEQSNRWHRACPHCSTEWDEPKWLEAIGEADALPGVDVAGLEALVADGKLVKHGQHTYSLPGTEAEIEERLRAAYLDKPIDVVIIDHHTGGLPDVAPVAPIAHLAKDHVGGRVSYKGMLQQRQNVLNGARNSFYAEGLRQLQEHLQELGQRGYAGAPPVRPDGWALLTASGTTADFHPRVRTFFGATLDNDAPMFDHEAIARQDRENPGDAPHRCVEVFYEYPSAGSPDKTTAQAQNTKCSNCGASPCVLVDGSDADSFDAFCSPTCQEQHEALGCPHGSHSGYRHPGEAARLIAAETVLRELASYVGSGGYNAPEVDAELFKEKIISGIQAATLAQAHA